MNKDINERYFGYWVLLAISVKKKSHQKRDRKDKKLD